MRLRGKTGNEGSRVFGDRGFSSGSPSAPSTWQSQARGVRRERGEIAFFLESLLGLFLKLPGWGGVGTTVA